MAYTAVTITTLTTITAADLNQLRRNAEHLRDENVGRVLVANPRTWSIEANVTEQMRLQIQLGSFTFLSDWSSSEPWIPIPGNVTNLDVSALVPGAVYAVVVKGHMGTPGSYLERDAGELVYFHTRDVRRISFLGEMSKPANDGYVRHFTVVGSHAGGLPAP